MSTLQVVRDAIRTAVVVASRLPDGAVVWADGPRPFASDPFILLSMPSAVPGHDRVFRTDDATTGNKAFDVESMQDLTVTIRVETLDTAGAFNAQAACERARVGFWRDSTTDSLRAVNCCWVGELGAIGRQDYVVDQRRVCAYSVDMLFRAVISDVPPGEETGTIEHVRVRGTLAPGPVTTDQTIDRP